ncbi:inorganic diphosphatase [Pseudosulfitobacter sp. DSM 107133]|uniref:inorganic diphosphatase n=1 Tax=Pseudosulfitobacter sp. DSM 107133 TaxID=2883100 RepID=UPI0013B3EE54|nr:inorganic diphosphatase [Pseudosulfitobacter sp. DSM 107133]
MNPSLDLCNKALEIYKNRGSRAQLREWARISKILENKLRAEIKEREEALAELRETSKLANELNFKK